MVVSMEQRKKTGTAVSKSEDYAVRIVNLCKYLRHEKEEYVLSKQLLRSGSSIGANVAEAQRAQSRADFLSKMSIALKEANETMYWLRILYRTHYLTEREFVSMVNDTEELLRLLTSICKTVSVSLKK